MKHLPLIALAALIVGCDEKDGRGAGKTTTAYTIETIDGCEYLSTRTHNGWRTLTHKGDCANHPHPLLASLKNNCKWDAKAGPNGMLITHSPNCTNYADHIILAQ